jgi:hypothetical protein|tara:strand:+ start:973 stop:1164 length:192 start_codon:yes stop_codon:yes gene_type:complete
MGILHYIIQIKSAKYLNLINGEKSVQVIDTNDQIISIPMVNANTDYQIVLEWVAAGNVIEEAD